MTRKDAEQGNLIVFGLGVWVVVISLILVIASLVHVHTVRRDMLNHADVLALELAQHIGEQSYYAADSLNLRPAPPTSGQVTVGEQNVTYTAQVSGDVVVVTMHGRARLPFVPDLLESVGCVELTVASSAELARMP
ncbi:hypothetical protein [Trueperella bialowiezensis]|uniref:Uncharacterized protein n=1 Tax=Trueperella bialowiezensis TaxID=312285 RepID=A0A3S4UZY3_9ACTO|nr:hypothetical protein [Trueperella bialowiezensis]VEI13960.1 Uncharacterised protein [Trueperella bialowiezensis]